jgi:hypothetical protein
VDARIKRELALTELSLLIIGIQPAGAPVLANTTRLILVPQVNKTFLEFNSCYSKT